MDTFLTCPICKESFKRFIDRKVSPEYLLYVVDKDKLLKEDLIRKNSVCPKCGLIGRFRLIYLYLDRHTGILTESCKVLHFAPEKALSDVIMQNPNIEYHSADIQQGLAMHVVDITDMYFGDEAFDYVICSHVLEHVTDDIKAMSEIRRVLKPGGQAIIMVPLSYDSDTTLEVPTNTDEERLALYGQADHVRLYGMDFPERMRKAGFIVETYCAGIDVQAEDVKRYSLLSGETVFIGRKMPLLC